jgi:hypothetical protein
MTDALSASIGDRRLVLRVGEQACLELPLDEGGRHRLVVEDIATARRAVAAIETCSGIGVLGASGSLPGAMTVAESLALALRYGQEEVDAEDDEREMEAALRFCGLPAQRIAGLGGEQPMSLPRAERWTIGLARWLLRPPELAGDRPPVRRPDTARSGTPGCHAGHLPSPPSVSHGLCTSISTAMNCPNCRIVAA